MADFIGCAVCNRALLTEHGPICPTCLRIEFEHEALMEIRDLRDRGATLPVPSTSSDEEEEPS